MTSFAHAVHYAEPVLSLTVTSLTSLGNVLQLGCFTRAIDQGDDNTTVECSTADYIRGLVLASGLISLVNAVLSSLLATLMLTAWLRDPKVDTWWGRLREPFYGDPDEGALTFLPLLPRLTTRTEKSKRTRTAIVLLAALRIALPLVVAVLAIMPQEDFHLWQKLPIAIFPPLNIALATLLQLSDAYLKRHNYKPINESA